MSEIRIEVRGLEEILANFRRFPHKFTRALSTTVSAGLTVLQENVPSYPAPPEGSTYIRTGTLGRSLGVGFSGQKMGQPDIKRVEVRGGYFKGTFGTRLGYAPYVIGQGTQAPVHQGRWWTIREVAQRARAKIVRVFEAMVKELALFLERG